MGMTDSVKSSSSENCYSEMFGLSRAVVLTRFQLFSPLEAKKNKIIVAFSNESGSKTLFTAEILTCQSRKNIRGINNFNDCNAITAMQCMLLVAPV